ncbi:MAG: Tad domain-containing protein [Anaerolineales bacterium]
MKKRELSKERGQVLVLLVIGFVVLLGFTALAVDGGMLYSDRRHAQSASDAASLAGGGAAALSMENSHVNYMGWSCSDTRVITAANLAETTAISRAASNDYTIDQDISDDHGVNATCGTEDNGSWIDKYIDVDTWITRDTSTAFAHLLYSGPLRGTVEAITRVRPRTPTAFGHAIVSLNDDPCSGNQNGVVLGGSQLSFINGGGIWSNGCLVCNGTAFDVDVVNGAVSYVGETDCPTNPDNIDPDPQQVGMALPDYVNNVPEPDCSGLPDRGSSTSGGIINPGIYSQIRLNNGELTMNPGLYCVTGSPNAVSFTGGVITGTNVTFHVASGDVTINGGADVTLKAPQDNPYPWILFYLPASNTSTFDLQGNDTSEFLGLIYAPGADVNISGANDTNPTFSTQVIAKNVEISGNADLNINFNNQQTFQVPSSMELYK